MRRCIACLRSLSALVLAILLSAAVQAQSSSAAAVSGRWTRVGPDGGDVLALAAAPSRSSTIYAGLRGSGVFRSTDGGLSWTFAGTRLGRGATVNALTVDAKQPGIVYALTGSGLFRSTSAGDGWARLSPPESAEHFPTAVAADPRRAGIVYVALDGGAILVSADRGHSWKQIGNPPDTTSFLVIDPVNTTTLYASTQSSGVFKSTDSGGRWTPITRGFHPALTQAAALAIDPRHPQTLFLATYGQAPYRSVDGGRHWTLGGTSSSSGLGTLPNVWALAVDPGSSTVFAGTPLDGAFRSTDGGVTWQKAGRLPDPSVRALLTASGGLLAGSKAGVSVSRDRAVTWRPGRGIKADSVFSLAIDSQNPPRIYVLDGALFKSANRGASWTRLAPPTNTQFIGPTGPVVVHPNDPQQIELGYVGEVARSDDGGHDWGNHFAVGCIIPSQIVLDPNDSEVLYTNGGFATGACGSQPDTCDSFKFDHGQVSCLRDPAIDPRGMRVIAIDPTNSSHLFASNGDLFHSTDAGATWSVLSAAIRPNDVLIFDPMHPRTLYSGAFPGGVARSADGGVTWRISTAGLPASRVVLSLAIDPVHTSTLYASTSFAVYRSLDSGATWAPLGTGLEDVLVFQVVIDPRDPDILHAATYGGGLMMFQVSQQHN